MKKQNKRPGRSSTRKSAARGAKRTTLHAGRELRDLDDADWNTEGGVVLASDLANVFADDNGATEEERQEYMSDAICLGQWLIDAGRPNDWDALDVKDAFDKMSLVDPRERMECLLRWSGLLGYAGLCDMIEYKTAVRYMRALFELSGESPYLAGLVGHYEARFHLRAMQRLRRESKPPRAQA